MVPFPLKCMTGSHTFLVKYEYDINGGDCITEKNTEIMPYIEYMQRARNLPVYCELLIYISTFLSTPRVCL